ncbi:hypothetical protein SERLA73DRAFT_97215, partial [Serpula lacrymans var. lacrymans S7.3]
MGTHHKAPARVLSSGHKLSEHLAAYPHLIGDRVSNKFNITDGQLPFLFKVLSFRKALPLQLHPDKHTAERLHSEQPDVYSDTNHKPEIAIALTPFKALFGFLPLEKIAIYLSSTPEFAALLPPVIINQFISVARSSPSESEGKEALRDLFGSFLTADVKEVKMQLRNLVKRYDAGPDRDEEKDIRSLIISLNKQYPEDSGVFCAFMLNYVELDPGQAIFLAAGEPHAYVAGDIIECMANSDNVLEAGFTSGQKDVPNFMSGLLYSAAPAETRFLPSSPLTREGLTGKATTIYDPPIDELAVMQVIVPKGEAESHPGLGGPSIAIVLEGGGTIEWGSEKMEVSKGHVIFIGQGTDVKFSAVEDELRVYRAYVEA